MTKGSIVTGRSQTWRVLIVRRDVYEVFVEASSAPAAEEQALDNYAELDDPEPYEREIESVHAEETGY
jgi:hypothetical protein